MVNQTQLQLVKIPLSRLLKLELPRFAERMIRIVESHNPEELQIKELYDSLVAESPKIKNLTDKFGPHPLTQELKRLREMRSLYISAIRLRLKIVIKEDAGGACENVKIARENINHFLHNLTLSKNDEMFNQKVAHFFEKIDADAELQKALSSLKFTDHIDDLERAHNTIQKLLLEKLNSISKRPKQKAPELANSVLLAINNLFKQIEIAPIICPNLNYQDLFNELNQLLIEYRDIINKRVLNNKRKAEKIKSKENSESIETTDTTNDALPEVEVIIDMNDDEEKTRSIDIHSMQKEVNYLSS